MGAVALLAVLALVYAAGAGQDVEMAEDPQYLHCPEVRHTLNSSLPLLSEVDAARTCNAAYPLLLHNLGTLSAPQSHNLQHILHWKQLQCNRSSQTDLSSLCSGAPVLYNGKVFPSAQAYLVPHRDITKETFPPSSGHALSPFAVLPGGVTHVIVLDNGQCTGGAFFQGSLVGAHARVHVRVTDLDTGLSLLHFRPEEPGNYTLEIMYWKAPQSSHVIHHLNTEPHYRELLLQRVAVVVTPPSDHVPQAPAVSCHQGPHSGRWVLEGRHWRYAAYGCALPLRGVGQCWACLRNKWILFHGDSTVEEDAISFVKVGACPCPRTSVPVSAPARVPVLLPVLKVGGLGRNAATRGQPPPPPLPAKKQMRNAQTGSTLPMGNTWRSGTPWACVAAARVGGGGGGALHGGVGGTPRGSSRTCDPTTKVFPPWPGISNANDSFLKPLGHQCGHPDVPHRVLA